MAASYVIMKQAVSSVTTLATTLLYLALEPAASPAFSRSHHKSGA